MLINLCTRQPAVSGPEASSQLIPFTVQPSPREVPKVDSQIDAKQLLAQVGKPDTPASVYLRLAEHHLPHLLATGQLPADRSRIGWYRKMLLKEETVDFDPFVADNRDFEAEVRIALDCEKKGEKEFHSFLQSYRFVRHSPFQEVQPSSGETQESKEYLMMKSLSENLVEFVKNLLKLDDSQRLKPLVGVVTKQIGLFPLERHLSICLHLEMINAKSSKLFYFPYFDELLNFISNPTLFLACHRLLQLARKALGLTSSIESIASYKILSRFGEEEEQNGPATVQHPTDSKITIFAITEEFLPHAKMKRRILPDLHLFPRDDSKEYELFLPSIVEVEVEGHTIVCDDIFLVFLQQRRVKYDKRNTAERDVYFEVAADYYVSLKAVVFHAADQVYELCKVDRSADLTIWKNYSAVDRLLQHLLVSQADDTQVHQSTIMYSMKQLKQTTKSQLFGLLTLKQPVDQLQFEAALTRLESNGFISIEGDNLKFIP